MTADDLICETRKLEDHSQHCNSNTGNKAEKELSLGVMVHTFNLSIWETGADPCELEASLVYISNFLASPGYTARSLLKTTKIKELSVISIHEASFCISVWRIRVFLEKAR